MDATPASVTGTVIVEEMIAIVLSRFGWYEQKLVHEDLDDFADRIDRVIDAAFEAGRNAGTAHVLEAIREVTAEYDRMIR
jgi:hypothetical protein